MRILFWVAIPCGLVHRYQRFGETYGLRFGEPYCLHLQGSSLQQYVSPKRWYLPVSPIRRLFLIQSIYISRSYHETQRLYEYPCSYFEIRQSRVACLSEGSCNLLPASHCHSLCDILIFFLQNLNNVTERTITSYTVGVEVRENDKS